MTNYSKLPLELSTRLKLATQMLVDFPQRPWGQASQLAGEYGVSRQWLYRLRNEAIAALTERFKPKPPGPKPKPKEAKVQKKQKAKLARTRRLVVRRKQDKNDAIRRKQKLGRRDRRRIAWEKMKFRRCVVHHYQSLKKTQNNKTAAQQTASHFSVGAET